MAKAECKGIGSKRAGVNAAGKQKLRQQASKTIQASISKESKMKVKKARKGQREQGGKAGYKKGMKRRNEMKEGRNEINDESEKGRGKNEKKEREEEKLELEEP